MSNNPVSTHEGKRRTRRGWLRDRSGSAAVEFALVSPVFFAFVFGFFEFSWAQHCESSVRTALEQAARAVTLSPTMSQSAIQTMVKNELATLADNNVTVTESIATNSYGKVATLTATYPHTIGIPGMTTFTINYSTTVKAELPTF